MRGIGRHFAGLKRFLISFVSVEPGCDSRQIRGLYMSMMRLRQSLPLSIEMERRRHAPLRSSGRAASTLPAKGTTVGEGGGVSSSLRSHMSQVDRKYLARPSAVGLQRAKVGGRKRKAMLERRKARKLHREDRHDRALLAIPSSNLSARSPAFCRLVSPCMGSRRCSAHGRFL